MPKRKNDRDKKSLAAFLKNEGAKIILSVMILGLAAIGKGIYQDVADLKAADQVQGVMYKTHSVQIKSNKEKVGVVAKQVNDLHWFFIKRNKVVVPNPVPNP